MGAECLEIIHVGLPVLDNTLLVAGQHPIFVMAPYDAAQFRVMSLKDSFKVESQALPQSKLARFRARDESLPLRCPLARMYGAARFVHTAMHELGAGAGDRVFAHLTGSWRDEVDGGLHVGLDSWCVYAEVTLPCPVQTPSHCRGVVINGSSCDGFAQLLSVEDIVPRRLSICAVGPTRTKCAFEIRHLADWDSRGFVALARLLALASEKENW